MRALQTALPWVSLPCNVGGVSAAAHDGQDMRFQSAYVDYVTRRKARKME